jgi:LacI family transcriptional regulator
MATIRDVAIRASVSIATVSRVLNNKGKYALKTAKIVQKAAEELGYIPNLTAKSLKTGSSGTIAFVIHDYFLVNYPIILASALNILNAQGFGVEVLTHIGLEGCIRLVRTGKIDGLLIAGIKNEEHALSALVNCGSHFVILGDGVEREDVNVVEVDYFQGGYIATQHLINLGHQSILFIEDNPQLTFTQEIKRGYLFALDENGIQYKEHLLVPGDMLQGEQGGYRFGIGEKEAGVSAMLTTDDRIAIKMIRALNEGGQSVPGDVTVVGFGDLSVSRYFDPPLTSVETPLSQMAELGAEILVNNIKRKDSIVKRVKLMVRFIARETHAKRLT